MERHEIPTHLDAADRAIWGLTMRQLLSAAAGVALAYGALSDLPLPFALRVAAAALVLLATALLVLWRPAGRPAEEWAFVLLRYCAARRTAVWRPRERRAPEERPPPEVLLPALNGPARSEAPRQEGGRDERAA